MPQYQYPHLPPLPAAVVAVWLQRVAQNTVQTLKACPHKPSQVQLQGTCERPPGLNSARLLCSCLLRAADRW